MNFVHGAIDFISGRNRSYEDNMSKIEFKLDHYLDRIVEGRENVSKLEQRLNVQDEYIFTLKRKVAELEAREKAEIVGVNIHTKEAVSPDIEKEPVCKKARVEKEVEPIPPPVVEENKQVAV